MNRRWVAVVATAVLVGGLVQAEGAANVAAPGPTGDVRAAMSTTGASAGPGNLLSIQRRIARLERQVSDYQRTTNRMNRWFKCIRHVGVDQVGDVEHRWGFHYDERDGTGLDTRTALVRHKKKRSRPDLVMLRLSRTRKCLSRPPDPNGTGADARLAPSPSSTGAEGLDQRRAVSNDAAQRLTVRSLQRSLNRLEKRVKRVEAGTERFDEWESCLSWLPVTEYGREYQNFGYMVDDPRGAVGADPDRHFAALDIDDSEWDDPDYQVLAFVGRDRPFSQRECENEPGEAVDRPVDPGRTTVADPRISTHVVRPAGSGDLRSSVQAAAEDVEDLLEPVLEFVTFDECMFTVGVQDRPGYRFHTKAGKETHRSALAFDMTGLKLPDFDVMAFPGEEPPQIECNEDAGGQNTAE